MIEFVLAFVMLVLEWLLTGVILAGAISFVYKVDFSIKLGMILALVLVVIRVVLALTIGLALGLSLLI